MAGGRAFLNSVIFSFLILCRSLYNLNTRFFTKKSQSIDLYSVSRGNGGYIWEYEGSYTGKIRLTRVRHVGSFYRKSFCHSRLQYYCNFTATFQLNKVLVSGNVTEPRTSQKSLHCMRKSRSKNTQIDDLRWMWFQDTYKMV